MSINIYKKWVSRLATGTLTHSEVRQWSQAVVPIALGLPQRGRDTNLRQDEAADLLHRIEYIGGVGLTDEHTEKGLQWLRRYANKTLAADHLPHDGQIPPDSWDHFVRFWYEGQAVLEWRTTPYGQTFLTTAVPVWAIHFDDRPTIRYYTAAWQSSASGEVFRGQWWENSLNRPNVFPHRVVGKFLVGPVPLVLTPSEEVPR